MSKWIAVTGGIGSGKSSVTAYLKELGYETYSCDEIYKEVIILPEYKKEICLYFPEAAVEGEIDRRKLSEIIFNNQEKRKLLNSVSHPLIMARLYEQMRQSTQDYIFAEIPLLFEGGFDKQFDRIIVVLRDKEQRIQSVQKRDNISAENVEKRIENQYNYEANVSQLKANSKVYLIENNSTLSYLKVKVDDFLVSI